MKVTRLGNNKRIIEYTPFIDRNTKVSQTVYELPREKRLVVDTVELNGKKQTQDKTLSLEGKDIKEIVVQFINGIRTKVVRVL